MGGMVKGGPLEVVKGIDISSTGVCVCAFDDKLGHHSNFRVLVKNMIS